MTIDSAPVLLAAESLLTIDGAQFVVERPAGETAKPMRWGFRAWYSHPRLGVAAICLADAGTSANSPLADATIVGEATTSRGHRLLALADRTNSEHTTTTFVYEAEHHELCTTRAGLDIPMEMFVEFLAPLDIDDDPRGLVVRPRPASGAAVDLHMGAAAVPDVAGLLVRFDEAARKNLPRNRGRTSLGGELWQVDDGRLLLANDSTVTFISPDPAASSSHFESLVDNLRLTRRPA